jgi:aminoglycoside phosphotransferase (APT) family kinase protein
MPAILTPNKPKITLSLVKELLVEQFPQWSDLPIRPVEIGGWDNRTFHLGDRMSVRLPSAECYAPKVLIEQQWLPFLARHLSISIPTPLALGHPSKNYPFYWSIYEWIEGKSANALVINKLNVNLIAAQLARFLNELHSVDSSNGPSPGSHNFYRGAHPSVYDEETRSALSKLHDVIDTHTATAVWDKALSSKWNQNPVWIHGDLSAGNIIIKDDRLAGVIDFGGMGIGDPACDLVIAWTFLAKESGAIFRSQLLRLDADTWARARGWALWKALITLASLLDKSGPEALKQLHVIDEILDTHKEK